MFDITNKQFKRIERYLEKIKDNRNRDLLSYEDDVITFYMHCWHMKDWVLNDESVSDAIKTTVESFCEVSEEMQICRDLCHKSKHVTLNDIRRDAEYTGHTTNIHCNTAVINKDGSQTHIGEAYGELTISVQANIHGKHGGKYPVEYGVVELGDQVVTKWKEFLQNNGILNA